MRVLIETKIFPNVRDPMAAPFNRLQFEALSKLCEVELIASVPWFPGETLLARRNGKSVIPIPASDQVGGLQANYQRVLYLPRIGRPLSGVSYAASLWPRIRSLRGRVDVVLAAFAYPDGFAGALLAKALGVPLVVKLHGTDINQLPKQVGLGMQIRWTLRQAAAVFGPSRPLVERAVELGANSEHAHVVLNGIDRSTFRVRDRVEAKRELGLASEARQLLFVGNPARSKGLGDLVSAMAAIKGIAPSAELIVIGDGPEAEQHRQQASQLGVALQLLGKQPHAVVAKYIAACEALVLPSWAEGTPNVVLEALASGRRVVATAVGGIPDVVTSPEHGILVNPRDVAALTDALRRVLSEPSDPDRISQSLPFGDWQQSARAVLNVLTSAVARAPSVGRNNPVPAR